MAYQHPPAVLRAGPIPVPATRPRAVTIAHTPTATGAAVEIGSSGQPARRASAREDPYLLLRRFDTVIVVDDSASMTEHWDATRAALENVASMALKHDEDGIDLYFMNNTAVGARNVKSATHIRRLFAQVHPTGITPTGECLDEILRTYLDRYADARKEPGAARVKPLNILVITDGEPTDDPESVIVSAARRLEALNAPLHQVGIQFLQIGDEPGAREALEELDDDLETYYGIRDMVDTTRYASDDEEISANILIKTLLGGVNRRWDRRED